jgi:hypothetical protein
MKIRRKGPVLRPETIRQRLFDDAVVSDIVIQANWDASQDFNAARPKYISLVNVSKRVKRKPTFTKWVTENACEFPVTFPKKDKAFVLFFKKSSEPVFGFNYPEWVAETDIGYFYLVSGSQNQAYFVGNNGCQKQYVGAESLEFCLAKLLGQDFSAPSDVFVRHITRDGKEKFLRRYARERRITFFDMFREVVFTGLKKGVKLPRNRVSTVEGAVLGQNMCWK